MAFPYILTNNTLADANQVMANFNYLLGLISGGGTNPALRIITSGTVDSAAITDAIIVWSSAATSAKSQTIPAGTAPTVGKSFTIVDGQGTAATYHITVAPASGTILGAASYVMSFNNESITFIDEGNGNYVIG